LKNANQFLFQPKTDQERETEQLLQQARSAAIRFIGLGRKSSGRIEDHLRQAGFEPDTICQVLQDLKVDQYIDDERIARRQVRNRSGAKSESSVRIAQRLAQGGVDEDAVQAALQDLPDDRTAARDALAARFRRHLNQASDQQLDQDAEQQMDHRMEQPLDRRMEQRKINLKMQRFLASRGFSAEITREAVRDFWKGNIDNDDDN
jgi:SOS response regulatory protein OraA/RecX